MCVNIALCGYGDRALFNQVFDVNRIIQELVIHFDKIKPDPPENNSELLARSRQNVGSVANVGLNKKVLKAHQDRIIASKENVLLLATLGSLPTQSKTEITPLFVQIMCK